MCIVCPRKKVTKAGENDSAVNNRANAVALSLEFLQPYFRKPLTQVSEELGLSATAIKKACRKFGVPKWPYRSLTSKTSRNRAALEEATRVNKPKTWNHAEEPAVPSIFFDDETENYLPRSQSFSSEDDFSRSSSSPSPSDDFPSVDMGVFESPLDDIDEVVHESQAPKMAAFDDSWIEPFLAVPEHSIKSFLDNNDVPDAEDYQPYHVKLDIDLA